MGLITTKGGGKVDVAWHDFLHRGSWGNLERRADFSSALFPVHVCFLFRVLSWWGFRLEVFREGKEEGKWIERESESFDAHTQTAHSLEEIAL